MHQKENRTGLVEVIIGLVLLILTIIWYIALFIDVRFCIFSCDIIILFLGALGLLFIIIGIHSLLPTPLMKGLLLLIVGSLFTGVGLYFTRYLLLNFRILKLSINQPKQKNIPQYILIADEIQEDKHVLPEKIAKIEQKRQKEMRKFINVRYLIWICVTNK